MKVVDSAMTHTLLSSPLPMNLAGKLLNEPGQPERQCVVIRVEREEEVGHASAVLLDTKLGCFGAWNLDLESANHPGLRPFNPGVLFL